MLKPVSVKQQASHKLIERLLAEHDMAIRRFIRIKTGCNQDCDDVMQDLYVRLSQIDDLPARMADRLDTARSYLVQIANHLLIDRARREASRCRDLHSSIETIESEPASAMHEPERSLMNKRKLQLIDKALTRLKPEHRKAFLLHRVEGLSYRQISDQLAVSVSTIEKYISAALVAIRSELARSEMPQPGWKP